MTPVRETSVVVGTSSEQIIHSFYLAFDDRSYEQSIAPFLTEDVLWHVAGENPLAGTSVGVSAVLSAMRRYGVTSNGTLRLETISLLADEHHVVAIHRASAAIDGFDYEAHEVDVFHLRGSQVAAIWSFSEDQTATDRLWSLGARQAP